MDADLRADPSASNTPADDHRTIGVNGTS